MKRQYLIVEHRSSAASERMKNEIASLRHQLSELQRRYSELESLYCSEISYNNALCDLLRLHNISFRQVFSNEYRSTRRH